MSRLTRDGTAELVSRDQILRHERGQGNIHFFSSADHVQDCMATLSYMDVIYYSRLIMDQPGTVAKIFLMVSST